MKSVCKEFICKLILVTIAGFIVFNFALVSGMFSSLIEILQPIFIGIVFALILNVPLDIFENKIFKKIKKAKIRFSLSLVCSVILLLGLISLILGLFFPAVVSSVQGLIEQVSSGSSFDELAGQNQFMNFIVTKGKELYESLISRINELMPKVMTIAQNVLKVAINIFMGIFIAIMLVSNRDNLKKQIRDLLHTFVKKPRIISIVKVSDIALTKFSKYLAGQLVEATLLASVCYIFMLILKLPYPALVSIIIGVVNLIPTIGAYVGGAFSAIIIFAVNPMQALIFIIFIIALQQIEAFTTYPIIVGRYVGLNSFWIIISLIIWGGIFGFWGLFLGVPLTAFLQEVITEYMKSKNEMKSLANNNETLWPEKMVPKDEKNNN
jgi:predicted PurR-regulated permease PerM